MQLNPVNSTAALVFLGLIQPTWPADTVAIVGVELVNPIGFASISDATVVVTGNRISTVGERSAIRVPADAVVIDGKGRWLIPGLMDLHVHFGQADRSVVHTPVAVPILRTIHSCSLQRALACAANGCRAYISTLCPLWSNDSTKPGRIRLQVRVWSETRPTVADISDLTAVDPDLEDLYAFYIEPKE